MNTQKKIVMMLSASFGIILMLVLVLWYLSQQRYGDIKKEEIKEKEHAVDVALAQSSKPLKNSVYDNSIWGALTDLTNPKVKLSAGEIENRWNGLELHTFFTSSKVEYIWVFNPQKKIVRSLVQSDTIPKIETPIPYTNIELALGAKKEFHFFLNEQGKIIEIAGYPLYSDTLRRGDPAGYMFFGKIVGESMLTELQTITNSKVILYNNTYQEFQKGEYQNVIQIPLRSWNDNSVGQLAFISYDKLQDSQDLHDRISLIVYVAFFVILIFFTFYKVKQLIALPLSQIMESLDAKTNEPIQELMHKNDEFGKIAKLMNKSFELSKQIESQYEKIQAQNNELESLNATKDKFFSIIAHDLRNPFGVILSTTEFISNPDYQFTKEELIDFSKDINHTAKTLFNLLENLLTWARSQRGNVPYEPDTMLAKDVIETTRFVLDSQAEVKKITIDTVVPAELTCFADKNMLLTIIRNLTSNAIKFTPNAGRIEIGAKDLKNGSVEFWVKDNGIGISPENLNKLFRIDVNVTTIGTSEEKGTGLGLILCKEFVEKHGGKIKVDSQINKGTSFIFTVQKSKPESNS